MAAPGQGARRRHGKWRFCQLRKELRNTRLPGASASTHSWLEQVLDALVGLASLPGSVACGQRRFRPQGRIYVPLARDAAVASGKIA